MKPGGINKDIRSAIQHELYYSLLYKLKYKITCNLTGLEKNASDLYENNTRIRKSVVVATKELLESWKKS